MAWQISLGSLASQYIYLIVARHIQSACYNIHLVVCAEQLQLALLYFLLSCSSYWLCTCSSSLQPGFITLVREEEETSSLAFPILPAFSSFSSVYQFSDIFISFQCRKYVADRFLANAPYGGKFRPSQVTMVSFARRQRSLECLGGSYHLTATDRIRVSSSVKFKQPPQNLC